jgi:hypothetical protein
MSIRNGELDLANRPWTYLTLIGTSVLMALVVGCAVGFALNGRPELAAVAVMGADAAPGLRSTATPAGTPTLAATNTPVAAVIGVTAAPPATKAGAATSTPLPTATPAQTAPSINALTSILPTVTPSSRAAPPDAN